MFHELLVDNGIKDFSDYWKERDWAEVLWEGGVRVLVYFDYFCDFDGVWVLVFINGFIEGGAMKFLRLLRIAGLILKMSEALLGFRVRRSLSTSSRDVGWREKGGCVVFVLGAIIRYSCWRGICRLVLCPIVM